MAATTKNTTCQGTCQSGTCNREAEHARDGRRFCGRHLAAYLYDRTGQWVSRRIAGVPVAATP